MSSIDQQFVEFVVKSLVSNPDAVQVQRRIDEKGVLLELTVDPEDLGRVIGKRGATAQSIRTLLRALGTKNDARYNLKIVDNGVGGHGSSSAADDDSVSDNTGTDDSATQPASQVTDEAGELDEEDTIHSSYGSAGREADAKDIDEDDVVAKTRKELEAYDDLDV
jgi:predicted RNA-binding protein YlqC (UPF0109 family)